MGYGVMRVQKIKMAGVKGIEIHMNREKEVSNTNPDIDFDRSYQNIYLQKCDDFRNAINRRIEQLGLSRKPRKDATVLVDCLITASPESLKDFSEEQRLNYFIDAYKAVQDRFGADNIISAVIHRDEPGADHMDVSFVPGYFDDQGKGHLSAKDMLGGHKEMSQIQTYFYNNVFEKYNLERGVIRGDGEQAKKHLDDAHFKAKMIAQEAEKAKAARDAAMQESEQLHDDINNLKTDKEAAENDLKAVKDELADYEEKRQKTVNLPFKKVVVNQQQLDALNEEISKLKKKNKSKDKKIEEWKSKAEQYGNIAVKKDNDNQIFWDFLESKGLADEYSKAENEYKAWCKEHGYRLNGIDASYRDFEKCKNNSLRTKLNKAQEKVDADKVIREAMRQAEQIEGKGKNKYYGPDLD